MNRRTMIIGLAGAAALGSRALAVEKPFRVSLVGDEFIGEGWQTGVRIELAEGWKTYWRMPGDAGIPPLFAWNKGTLGDGRIEVLYPLPGRYQDASGETIGYKDEVIFPIRLKQADAMEMKLDLDLFFAVCREICIPAQSKAEIELGTAMRDPRGSALVGDWLSRIPQAGEVATMAEVVTEAGKPVLRLRLKEPARDIFVEADGGAYFRAPVFTGDGREAVLPIDNVDDPAKLQSAALRLTFDMGGRGLEQTLLLA